MAVLEVDDTVGHAVEELPVMRDQQQRTGILAQPALEPQNRIEIEVIGGLIEQ